jgi:nucleotide-binding universal stress UspA family protein
MDKIKNILACIDFHKKTDLLVDTAILFAKPFNSKVWLLHVAAPDPDFVGYEVGPQYIRDGRAKELKQEHQELFRYVDQLEKNGIASEALLIQGPTIDIVLEEAKKLNADLIIAGHHEHGFFYNVFSGHISSHIISKSKIPVLIIPLDD